MSFSSMVQDGLLPKRLAQARRPTIKPPMEDRVLMAFGERWQLSPKESRRLYEPSAIFINIFPFTQPFVMTRLTFTLFLSALLCGVLFSAGCGRGRPKPPDMPPLYPCTLTFTQQGVPLTEASIVLHSDSKWAVSGKTNEKGEAKLVTSGFYDGVPAGTYKITVTKFVVVENETTGATMKRTDVMEKQFKKAETTPLEITIGKSGNNQTFDVGKAVSINLPISD